MAVSYDSIEFLVLPDGDGFLPMPIAAEGNNPRTYIANVRMISSNDLDTLRTKKSVITIVPALGFVAGGTIIVEAGVGGNDLIYPSAEAAEITETAILTEISDQMGFLPTEEYRATLKFVLVE
jgi:hypothetical protein